MAVYERTYAAHTGDLTPVNTRFLVLPRYAIGSVFQSKLFIAFFVLCLVWPLALSLLIYLPHSSKFLSVAEQLTGGAWTLKFQAYLYPTWFVIPQWILAFFMSLFIGPGLVSSDLRNNALPLYFARPLSRPNYMVGKSLVLASLLSSITWIPGGLLFLLHSYLEGWSWFIENLRTGVAIFLIGGIWILMLCVISLVASAYLRWKVLAAGAIFGVFLFLAIASAMLNYFLQTDLGSLLNISDMLFTVSAWLFGVPSTSGIPVWAAWGSLLTFSAIFVGLLSRKIRAYEVVK
ncbi:MAG: hypothetical protein GWM88_06375 [Pseudomonadales bacterium]|nr:hypothetical protein [Pseudomonadales bacterium]NIX07649.1 hypothetical protein [Pseudomonadales bacterium]